MMPPESRKPPRASFEILQSTSLEQPASWVPPSGGELLAHLWCTQCVHSSRRRSGQNRTSSSSRLCACAPQVAALGLCRETTVPGRLVAPGSSLAAATCLLRFRPRPPHPPRPRPQPNFSGIGVLKASAPQSASGKPRTATHCAGSRLCFLSAPATGKFGGAAAPQLV